MSELKEEEVKDAKPKKKMKPKKKNKKATTKKKEAPSSGPPLKSEDFSSNWKAFLKMQQLKDMTTQKTMKIDPKLETMKNIKSVDVEATLSAKAKKEEVKKKSNKRKAEEETQEQKIAPEKKKIKKKEEKTIANEEKKLDVWFDVDPMLLQKVEKISVDDTAKSTTDNEDSSVGELTKRVAIDCEMVGVGFEGKENVLARVSIVNSTCKCVYDKYVTSHEKVVDYRTHVSGIRPTHLKNACDFKLVQKEVSDILKDRVLVGHAVHNDLKVLLLSHPKKNTRDTSKYKPFRTLLKTKRPALKRLAEEILHKEIQTGEHNSVIDAQITMEIYNRYRKEWEKSLHGKKEGTAVQPKEIYMGDQSKKKKGKMNKWKRIKAEKKKKKKKMEEEED